MQSLAAVSLLAGTPHQVWCPVVCGIAKGAAKSGFQEVVGALADGASAMLTTVGTFWLKIPDPQVSGSSGAAAQLTTLTDYQKPFIAALSAMGFMLGLGKIVWENRAAQHARDVGRGLIVLTVSSALTLVVFQTLLEATDAFSPWILQRSTGSSHEGDAISTIIQAMLPSAAATQGSGIGAWFLLALLMIIGAGVQLLFMVVRGAVLYVLAAFIPWFAATSFTEEGWLRFKRAIMLMLAFTLYKPVAAIIYSVGYVLLHAPASPADKSGTQIMTGIYALTILALAALALPSLIKFLVPIAAAGSSGAFSGAAAIGAIAAGAAAVATMGGSGAAMSAGGAGKTSGVTQMPSPGGQGLIPGSPSASPSGGGESSSAGAESTGDSSPEPAPSPGGASESAPTTKAPSSGADAGGDNTVGNAPATGGNGHNPSGGGSGHNPSGGGSGHSPSGSGSGSSTVGSAPATGGSGHSPSGSSGGRGGGFDGGTGHKVAAVSSDRPSQMAHSSGGAAHSSGASTTAENGSGSGRHHPGHRRPGEALARGVQRLSETTDDVVPSGAEEVER